MDTTLTSPSHLVVFDTLLMCFSVWKSHPASSAVLLSELSQIPPAELSVEVMCHTYTHKHSSTVIVNHNHTYEYKNICLASHLFCWSTDLSSRDLCSISRVRWLPSSVEYLWESTSSSAACLSCRTLSLSWSRRRSSLTVRRSSLSRTAASLSASELWRSRCSWPLWAIREAFWVDTVDFSTWHEGVKERLTVDQTCSCYIYYFVISYIYYYFILSYILLFCIQLWEKKGDSVKTIFSFSDFSIYSV